MTAKSSGLGSLEKWDTATTSKFLKLYRENKCLWDFTDPAYKDKAQRNAAVDKVAKTMSIPGFDSRYVILKIRALRSTYIYERRKVRIRLKNGEKFQTHLGWYHLADSFLRKYVVEKTHPDPEEDKTELPPPMSFDECEEISTEISIKQNDQSTTKDELIEFLTCTDKKFSENTIVELNFKTDDDIPEIPTTNQTCNIEEKSPIQIQQVRTLNRRRSSRKRSSFEKHYSVSTLPSAALDENNRMHSSTPITMQSQSMPLIVTPAAVIETKISETPKNPDVNQFKNLDSEEEFDTFGNSVSAQLRKLPREDAYVLQTQFQFLLSQAKLKAMGIQGSFGGFDSSNFFNFSGNK